MNPPFGLSLSKPVLHRQTLRRAQGERTKKGGLKSEEQHPSKLKPDEFKTHLRGASTVLRSKTPELVQQELWGLLLAHFAVRQLMAQAAWNNRLDPDRLSFVHAVRVIKRKMPQAAAIPP